VLHALGGAVPVWPVDPLPTAGSVVVEIYTTIAAMEGGRTAGTAKMRSFEALNAALAALESPPVPGNGAIDDHASAALLTAAWLRIAAQRSTLWQPRAMTDTVARTEGWTFGVP